MNKKLNIQISLEAKHSDLNIKVDSFISKN